MKPSRLKTSNVIRSGARIGLRTKLNSFFLSAALAVLGTLGGDTSAADLLFSNPISPGDSSGYSDTSTTTFSGLSAITVSSLADSGPGSLRQAIAEIAANGTITIAANGVIRLETGELLITKSLTIQGPGANLLTISGNQASRVFKIESGSVTLAALTVADGKALTSGEAFGGGIYKTSPGALTLRECALIGNTATTGDIPTEFATSAGGAIFSDAGNVILVACTLHGNLAQSSANWQSGSMGGAIYCASGTLDLIASTVSGNQAEARGGEDMAWVQGGAIYHDGDVHLTSCTVVYNAAHSFPEESGTWREDGGAIFGSGGTTTVRNSILALNQSRDYPDYADALHSLGYNILHTWDGLEEDAPGDQFDVDPLLTPLADNGGPTWTHALLPGSPAIDKGYSFDLAADQRGAARPIDNPSIPPAVSGDNSDIGAFELDKIPPTLACVPIRIISCGQPAVLEIAVSDMDDGETLTVSLKQGANELMRQIVSTPADNVTVTFDLMALAPGEYPFQVEVTDETYIVSCDTSVLIAPDSAPPVITCPPSQIVNATSPSGATVTYEASATDNCGPATIGYSINPGSLFPIGDTIVTATATDDAGNSSSCGFHVHVKGAIEQINDLITKVNGLPGVKEATKIALVVKLQAALAAVAKGQTAEACSSLTDFISLAKAQKDKKLVPTTIADGLIADATRINAVLGCS